MNVVLWQCDAHNKTMLQAVNEFCAEHWSKPRRHAKLIGNRFKLRDGVQVYEWVGYGRLRG